MNKAVFKRIKQRPGLYIGHASIRNFYSFLGGYYFARMDLEITHTKQDRECSGFQEWIQDKYDTTTRHSWADIILLNSEDDKAAFWKFFDLLDEYVEFVRSKSQFV